MYIMYSMSLIELWQFLSFNRPLSGLLMAYVHERIDICICYVHWVFCSFQKQFSVDVKY